MVNKERLVEEFVQIVKIDSTTLKERELADYLIKTLEELGFLVEEDNAGDHYKSQTGNLYAFCKGTIQGPPILLSAHMDTVEPGNKKTAIVRADGRITSDGTTVLGADDVSGMVAILEAIRVIRETKENHRDIELLFTIGEEAYLLGSQVFDFHKIKAKDAYVLDLCGPIGTAAIQAPTVISFEIELFGKASHAGFAPEEGLSSILLAAQIISKSKHGRIDKDTTLNFGKIEGGKGTNIVADYCVITGEIRSTNHQEAIAQLQMVEQRVKEEIASALLVFKKNNQAVSSTVKAADYKLSTSFGCIAYTVEKDSSVVARFEKANEKLGYPVNLITTFGGSDNNNFLMNGIQGIVMACGMEQVHSCEEYTEVESLVKCTNVVVELLKSME